MLDAFLSRNGSGLVIGAGVLGLGGVVILGAGLVPVHLVALAGQALGAAIAAAALVLLAASARHLILVARHARKFPPPGRLIDVGGYRIHYVAAGEGTPTVVWIPGSHSQGLALNHLHKLTAQFTRSIIFDRPSSGWSDVGPIPRSIPGEARELEALLRLAGETPPFVIAAHSLGGAVATKFADLFPEQTAGLVMLDITTPDASIYANSLQRGRGAVPGLGMLITLKATFGLLWPRRKRPGRPGRPAYAGLADVAEAMAGNDAQPRSPVAFLSVIDSLRREPLGMAKGRHALGDIPIFAVFPPDMPFPTVEAVRAQVPHISDDLARGYIRNYRDAQESVARLSRRGAIRLAPPGATHAFPYESPDFVVTQVREMVDLLRADAAPAAPD